MTDNAVGGKYMIYADFQKFVIGNTSRSGGASDVPPYNSLIWSTQSEYLSYGFNVYCEKWKHKVRWGGTFNENANLCLFLMTFLEVLVWNIKIIVQEMVQNVVQQQQE